MSKIAPKYTIETINVEERDKVYKFALEYFIKDEPLCSSLGLLDCKEIKEFILNDLPDKCSFKAVNEQGELIGLVISGIRKRPTAADKHDEVKNKIENEKWRKIGVLIDYCYNQWNIYDLYPNANAILDGKIIAVDPKYRGLGIAGQLIKKCGDFMREHNIPVMKRICSSYYSARVMEKMGLKEVHKLAYKDFKVNGEVFLTPAAPHVEIRSFVLEV